MCIRDRVLINIIGCVWLLLWTSRRRPGDPAPDDTSHVWDGDLTEYNKPLPRWWINPVSYTHLDVYKRQAVVWVAYGVLFFGTIAKRTVKHIYVANWFYGAYIIAIALLHIVNSLAIPSSLLHSYPIYSGAVDAMVQWWYGHNAVGFFLTAGFLGMMYYFVPKQAGRCLLYTSRCV